MDTNRNSHELDHVDIEAIVAEARAMRSAFFADLLKHAVQRLANLAGNLRPRPHGSWDQRTA